MEAPKSNGVCAIPTVGAWLPIGTWMELPIPDEVVEMIRLTDVALPRTLFNWLAFTRTFVRRRVRVPLVPGGSNGMPLHTMEVGPT